MRVLWPWEKALYYPEELLVGSADVVIPCTENAEVPPRVVEEGDPYVTVTPNCGDLSEIDGVEGTKLHMLVVILRLTLKPRFGGWIRSATNSATAMAVSISR